MIARIQNRFLRGLAAWGLVLAFVAAFPFIVIFGASVDAWRNVKDAWRGAKDERRDAWRLMTFRSVE